VPVIDPLQLAAVKSRFVPIGAETRDHDLRQLRQSAEVIAVPTTYDSTADQSLPLLLAKDAAAARRQRTFQRLGSALLVLTATAVGSAALALEDPIAPLVAVSTSLGDVMAAISGQAPVSPVAIAPSAESNAPTRFATAAAAESATPDQPATAGESSGTLLKQFVAWADDQEQQERIEALGRQQPATLALAAEDVTASVVPEDSASFQTPQPANARIRNAWAELPPAQPSRTKSARVTHASVKPVEAAQTRSAPARNAQPPSLLQMFGWHG
jgi:hypothetical protein